MRFGCHVSVAGKIYLAVDRAEARGCETMQIFSGNPRGWQEVYHFTSDIQEFNTRRKKAQIYPLVIHLPYLVNLGAPDTGVYSKSVEAMLGAIRLTKKLDATYLVFHPGSHRGMGREQGLKKVAEALSHFLPRVNQKIKVLLENTAGQGFSLGSNFNELKFIFEKLNWDRQLGICLDTAHAFAAGYDLSSQGGFEKMLKELNETLGLERLFLVHANDSRTPCGSRVDRHEDIGKGFIGLDGFSRMVNHSFLCDLPCILETPRMDIEDDIRNLTTIRALTGKV